MRRLAVLVIATSVLSCSNLQKVGEQAPLPAPTLPPLHAPICARPAEKEAIDVSALLSELQLITLTCHTNKEYNTLILHLRPALATKEKNLDSFFTRAYGKRGQLEHDKYITELANLQSQFGLKSGAGSAAPMPACSTSSSRCRPSRNWQLMPDASPSSRRSRSTNAPRHRRRRRRRTETGAAEGLTRISHRIRCIGAPNQRKSSCQQSFSWNGGFPRCRQSVAQSCSPLHL